MQNDAKTTESARPTAIITGASSGIGEATARAELLRQPLSHVNLLVRKGH